MASMAWGQTAAAGAAAGPASVTDVLRGMSDRAAVIFMGQVLAVRLPESADPASGIVEVEFRVDRAIRGCTAGEPFVLREWGGLWVGGNRRYRVGQRLLMLLHAPGAGGMSSPVGGLEGAIPVRQGDAGAELKESAGLSSGPYVDLRWLGARVPRTISYRSEPVRAAGALPRIAAAAGLSGEDGSGVMPLGSIGAGEASSPAQQASVDAVLGLLVSWQRTGNATP
ncbi:hypothetical protein [Granulicella sp. S190]|uniref:hypothetical protein n=1 Tax=Granulicella sp. S190 TaxID=1747226 RepID=UPI00131E0468|nr:hypothetical protein [Granulicella sp. S190]